MESVPNSKDAEPKMLRHYLGLTKRVLDLMIVDFKRHVKSEAFRKAANTQLSAQLCRHQTRFDFLPNLHHLPSKSLTCSLHHDVVAYRMPQTLSALSLERP